MRILLTSCDRLGDAILRQPLFAALQAAGHQLMILAWDPVIPLLEQLIPQAKIKGIGADPYSNTIHQSDPFAPDLLPCITEFAPELLVVGPYQWTILEEYLAAKLPTVPRIGMNGHPFKSPVQLPPALFPGLTLQRTVTVGVETHELTKNMLLCQAILGNTESLPDPTLKPTAGQLEAARIWLAKVSFEPENYWLACVGTAKDHYSYMKDWGPGRWVKLLQDTLEKYKRPIVFVGSPAEMDSINAICKQLGDQQHLAIAVPSGQGYDQLIGLTALAHGYIGKDTGPMHLAAALGKRVLGVFGGGHWPRFVPAVDPSCVLTVRMPCAGCGWNCWLTEPNCIRKVDIEAVIAALADLESGRVQKRELRIAEPTAKQLEADLKAVTLLRQQDKNEICQIRQQLDLQKARLKMLSLTPSRRILVRLGLVRNQPWETDRP